MEDNVMTGGESIMKKQSCMVDSITELIGDIPAVKVNRLGDPDAAEVFMKLEYFNPSGSVKDRAAFNLIAEAPTPETVSVKIPADPDFIRKV
jgi:Pyridoxal-phosphate dependent enzyme